MAVKPAVPRVPLAVLLIMSWFLDILAIVFSLVGIEVGNTVLPWSHGLFMSVIWSVAAGLLAAGIFHDRRAGLVIGLVLFSHWILDFISHPIPYPSFSWSHWKWDYGQPLSSDLTLLFSPSPKLGLGLYNSISAVQATVLECVMFALGTAVYFTYIGRSQKREI